MTDQLVSASIRIRVGSEDAHYGSIAAGAFVVVHSWPKKGSLIP